MLGLGAHLPGALLGLSYSRPSSLLGLSNNLGRLGLTLSLGLVDKLLGQQQGPLQRLVGDPGVGVGHRRLGSGTFPALALKLGDPLGGLAEALGDLPDLLLIASASTAAFSRYSSTSSTLYPFRRAGIPPFKGLRIDWVGWGLSMAELSPRPHRISEYSVLLSSVGAGPR